MRSLPQTKTSHEITIHFKPMKKPTELLPGVKLVAGAFPRLIDLQLQGFACLKFE